MQNPDKSARQIKENLMEAIATDDLLAEGAPKTPEPPKAKAEAEFAFAGFPA